MHIFGTRNHKTSIEVADFLRKNDRVAGLLPTAMRLARLQNDCTAVLPAFANADVLGYQEGTLTLAVPSSAVAARLKQQLSKLQSSLQQHGWQVESVRLKVQVTRAAPQEIEKRSLKLPPTAVQAFEELGDALEDTPQNAGLVAAIKALAAKRRQG